ncbi:MAG: MarC family protein [Armatimonadia bacterium]
MDPRALLTAIAQDAVALFIIVDPVLVLPLFAALLKGMSRSERSRTINLGVLVAALILILFATIGRPVMSLFGVGLPEFMAAGGVMLFLIGLDEIFGLLGHLGTYQENIGIVPLACPLLAGPGAIVTTMLIVQRNPFPTNYLILSCAIVLALGATWVIFYYTEPLMRILGTRGSLILGKLMGILVAAIGTHFILQGLADFWASAAR